MMQEVVGNLEQNAKVSEEHAIVPKTTGALEAIPMACTSATDQIMQLQLNVLMKSRFKHCMT